MGALTLAELKTGVRDHFSGRTDKDTRLTQLLNIAQIRLVRDHDFEEMKGQTTLEPTFTGTLATDKFIAIPSTVKEIFSVAVIDGDAGYPVTQKAGRTFAKKSLTTRNGQLIDQQSAVVGDSRISKSGQSLTRRMCIRTYSLLGRLICLLRVVYQISRRRTTC